jgi:hypothetical protein
MARIRAETAALLVVLTLALYGGALGHYFIADDFVNLDFVRSYRGSWLAFLDPTRMFSDPVTHTRYKPFHIYDLWLLDAAFGDHAFAYHALSLLLHAVVGMAVWNLAWDLFRERATATAAAVLFVSWRLQSQTVVWISANPRVLSTGLALLAIAAPAARPRASAVVGRIVLFAFALGMNPEVVVVPPILGCFVLYRLVGRGRDLERARRLAWTLAGCAAVTATFLGACWLSHRAFPERPVSLAPDPGRLLLFTTNLFVPFELPLGLKIALPAVVTVAAVCLKDARLLLMLACIAVCAIFWGLLSGYPLTPRYLYLAWAFGSVVVARLLYLVGSRAAQAQPVRWRAALPSPPAWRRCAAVAALLVPLLAANAWSVRWRDLVHFEYLTLLGRRLAQVQHEARSSGRRTTVFVRPFSSLGAGDLAFFRREIRFVGSPEAAERIVDTGVARYRSRLGPRMAEGYWYLPWFDVRIGGR